MIRAQLAVAAAVLASPGVSHAQGGLQIVLVNDSAAEQGTRAQLEQILQEYDLSRWIFTRDVKIDEGARIPHSHPVLTLDTGSPDETDLLSTFVHEQIHWFQEMHPEQKELAISELTVLYPEAPDGPPDGARDRYSTYLHLLVCYLEFEALKDLVGVDLATERLSARPYYRWVYRTILEEGEKIRAIVEKHGLTI